MTVSLGNLTEDSTVYFTWDSNDAGGASVTRATDGTVSVYKDDNLTQSVAGVTDTEDFDGLTGHHKCKIILTDAFYVTGSDYSVVLSAATIDGEPVNTTLAYFSIENRFIEADLTKINGTALASADLPLKSITVNNSGGDALSLTATGYGIDFNGGTADIRFQTFPAIDDGAGADWFQTNIASGFTTYDPPTAAEMDARTLLAADYFDPTADAVATVTTLTGHTAQTGDSYARLGAPSGASIAADIAVIQADLPVSPTKGVALANFLFFMRDSSNHISGATGKTVSGTIKKDGGAFTAIAGTITEVANGMYVIDSITAAEMNANVMTLRFTATGADDLILTFFLQPT